MGGWVPATPPLIAPSSSFRPRRNARQAPLLPLKARQTARRKWSLELASSIGRNGRSFPAWKPPSKRWKASGPGYKPKSTTAAVIIQGYKAWLSSYKLWRPRSRPRRSGGWSWRKGTERTEDIYVFLLRYLPFYAAFSFYFWQNEIRFLGDVTDPSLC